MGPDEAPASHHVTESSCQLAPAQVGVARPRETPLSAESFALQFTIGRGTHDKLAYVRALLSHRLASGDVAQVFDLALDALVARLEKRKFAATRRPQKSPRPTTGRRHIPAHVRRAVWDRDGGRCTFVAENGQRCQSRERLEFDHIDPVSRGGRATVDGVRLRCRAHNRLEAERVFGDGVHAPQARASAASR